MILCKSIHLLTVSLQRNKLLAMLILLVFTGFASAQNIVIYTAKKIYLANDSFHVTESMAIENGKILDTGRTAVLAAKYPNAQKITIKGFIYPGLIDAHCHFFGYSKGLAEVNLWGTQSEEEAIARIKKFAAKNPLPNGWIIGRGWDQNDWVSKSYPSKASLDKAFPNTPIYLSRVDGHAAWVNSAALKAIGYKDTFIQGGEFIQSEQGFTGIAIDNAADWISNKIPKVSYDFMKPLFAKASQTLKSYGITAFAEAGLETWQVEYLLRAQQEGLISQHIYAMLMPTDENFAKYGIKGPQTIGNMHIKAFKFYYDGALGSRGALLKHDYCDRGGYKGLELTKPDKLEQYAQIAMSFGYQICVHAIGDSAHKQVLNIFLRNAPPGADYRWRVEHAQITDPKDFVKYAKTGIIPSVQPTHATSDAPWAFKRLCGDSREGAYAYKTLLDSAGIIALGTDFPVEQVSPFNTFYSAVFRKDLGGTLKSPFLPEQALTRQQALWGMTQWAAFAMFEEYERGMLLPGMKAEFVALNVDLMVATEKQLKKIKVLKTVN